MIFLIVLSLIGCFDKKNKDNTNNLNVQTSKANKLSAENTVNEGDQPGNSSITSRIINVDEFIDVFSKASIEKKTEYLTTLLLSQQKEEETETNRKDIIKRIVELGLHRGIKVFELSPSFIADHVNNLEIFEIFINDVEDINETDKYGNSHLKRIFKKLQHNNFDEENKDILEQKIRILLEKGADINKKTLGWEPDIYIFYHFLPTSTMKIIIDEQFTRNKEWKVASDNNLIETLKRFFRDEFFKEKSDEEKKEIEYEVLIPLLNAMNDINHQTLEDDFKKFHGFTLLMLASSYNFVELAKSLIEKGANVNIENSQNKKAVDFAKTDEMKKLLNK